ncbi:MAG: hypothetical protein EBS42_02640, partial [Caulobacteraceae bacterium]|nr:hypothetical protein [Caulobacteraceae bacterium]
TRIYRPSTERFEIELGPIFANFVLADEINRAPAKVQSALLEVMAERHVSIGGNTHPVPEPFLVLATQNPIESEGVYPLPEAQRDRFLMKVVVPLPTPAEEMQIVQRMGTNPPEASEQLSLDELRELQKAASEVFVHHQVADYAVRLVLATREPEQHGLVGHTGMEAGIVDPEIFDPVQHFHPAPLQGQAVGPAGGLAQRLADGIGLALHQGDFPVGAGHLWRHAGHPAPGMVDEIDAPFLGEDIDVHGGRDPLMGDQLGHVEADAAGAHDGHPLADGLVAQDGVDIADDLGVIDAVQLRPARLDAGGDDDLVVSAGLQQGGVHRGVQFQADAQDLDALAEIAQGLVELFLAGDAPGQVELAADVGTGLIEGDVVAPLRRHGGIGQARRAGPDHGDLAGRSGGLIVQLGLAAGPGIDQATGQPAGEGMVQAGLVAGDAGIDLVLAALEGLQHQVRVGQHGAGHGDQVGVALGQDGFGHVRHVDAVAGDHRNGQFLAQPPGDLGEGGAGHHGGDGRDLGLVPAEMGRDDCGPGGDHGLAQGDDFLPGQAPLQHVHGRDAEDDDEVRSHGLAHPAHHLDGEPHAVLETAAPLVGALVGAFHQEGGQQIAGRPDDLDPVIAGQLGHGCAVGEIGQLFLDAVLVQLMGHVGGDPGADGRGGHGSGGPGQRPGMEDLQADLDVRIGGMDRLGHHPVLGGLFQGLQLGAAASLMVGADAAGDDHADPAPGPFGEIGRLARKPAGDVLQPRMHGPHDHPVLQPGETQIQRREQVGILGQRGHGGSWCFSALLDLCCHWTSRLATIEPCPLRPLRSLTQGPEGLARRSGFQGNLFLIAGRGSCRLKTLDHPGVWPLLHPKN